MTIDAALAAFASRRRAPPFPRLLDRSHERRSASSPGGFGAAHGLAAAARSGRGGGPSGAPQSMARLAPSLRPRSGPVREVRRPDAAQQASGILSEPSMGKYAELPRALLRGDA